MTNISQSNRMKLLLSFAAVYIIWGSTYLAIRFSIETLPPLLMVGVRFLIGGSVFLIFSSFTGTKKPTFSDWKIAGYAGVLMILGGTGLVSVAEMKVESAIAATMVAAMPLWMVLFDWFRPGGTKPCKKVVGGLILGVVGVFLLVNPGEVVGSGSIDLIGAILLLLATIFWAIGSLVSRYGNSTVSGSQMLGMNMLAGGAAAIVAGLLSGELAGFDPALVSTKSVLALVYQITFGSLGFAAYLYLLKNTTPAKAGTYAYVNPVIAVILGLTLGQETITSQSWLAMLVILSAVVLITTYRRSTTSVDKAEEPISKALSRENSELPVVKTEAAYGKQT